MNLTFMQYYQKYFAIQVITQTVDFFAINKSSFCSLRYLREASSVQTLRNYPRNRSRGVTENKDRYK